MCCAGFSRCKEHDAAAQERKCESSGSRFDLTASAPACQTMRQMFRLPWGGQPRTRGCHSLLTLSNQRNQGANQQDRVERSFSSELVCYAGIGSFLDSRTRRLDQHSQSRRASQSSQSCLCISHWIHKPIDPRLDGDNTLPQTEIHLPSLPADGALPDSRCVLCATILCYVMSAFYYLCTTILSLLPILYDPSNRSFSTVTALHLHLHTATDKLMI